MSNSSQLVKNTFSLLTAQIVCKLAELVFIALIVRYLTMSDFGIYTIIMTFLVLAGFFSDFGIQMVIVRDVAQDKSKGITVLSNSILVMMVFSLICWITMVILAQVLGYPPMTRMLILLAGASLLFNSVAQPATAILKAFERMEILALITTIVSIATSALGILALKLGYGLFALIWLVVLTGAVNSVIFLVIVHKGFAKFSFNFNAAVCRRILKQSFPVAILMACTIILRKIDIVMLSKMKEITDVAIYGISVKLIDSLIVFSGSAVGALFPFMSAQWGISPHLSKQTYEKSLGFFVILGFGLATGITILADKIIPLVFGGKYVLSVLPLRVLIWAFFFILLGGPVGLILIISKDRLSQLVLFSIIVVILNISLNLLLIPRYSYVGASIARLICSMAMFALRCFMTDYLFEKRPNLFKVSFRPFLAACLMGTIILPLRNFNLFFVILLSGIVYLSALIVLGEFKERQYDFLHTFIHRLRVKALNIRIVKKIF